MAAAGSNIQPLLDTTELVELFKPCGLYLKPVAKLSITVQLPLMKEPGRTISNWDLMEKLKKIIKPHHFSTIKVAKSALEFVRFEAEVDNRSMLASVIELLDDKAIKIIGFFESFKVKATEAKLQFPTRHDWDSFFRDSKNMNEMKPGERPDTIHLSEVPCKWFLDKRHSAQQEASTSGSSAAGGEPSEFVLKRIFETFGDVRCVDIPLTDPYRREMATSKRLQTFNFNQDLTFDAYVQFTEYISFVKAMDALRGMKLVHVDHEGKASSSSIKVEFDKTKHLSDKKIRQRRVERERLKFLEKQKEEKLRKQREEEERQRMEEEQNEELRRMAEEERKFQRRREREEKRRLRQLEKRKEVEEQRLERKIRLEERKMLLAQRRLQSMRLLSDIFMQIKLIKQKERVEEELRELERLTEEELQAKEQIQAEEHERKARMLQRREQQLRSHVMEKWERKESRRRMGYRSELPENVFVPRWKPYEKRMPGRLQRQGIWDRVWNLDDNLDLPDEEAYYR